MALRKIRKDGDAVLRKISKPVEVVDERMRQLALDMVDTMYEEDGVGLAAPQVGVLKRIIVVDIYDETGVKVLFNPEIVEEEGLQCDIEGCLSVPERTGYVNRPQKVRIKGLDLNGDPIEYESEGLLARAFCHEIDHLNGILFIDIMIEEDKKHENRVHGNI